MRSSRIFNVCGLPEIKVNKLKDPEALALVLMWFDPVTMEAIHRDGGDVPIWLLDTDYNGLVLSSHRHFSANRCVGQLEEGAQGRI